MGETPRPIQAILIFDIKPFQAFFFHNRIDMQKIRFLFIALTALAMPLTAQEITGGFKAGLNFSIFDGETLENETYGWNTGFHIAATFIYPITDLFGLKGELMYSQKGVKYDYDGPSYLTFYNNQGARLIIPGQRRTDLSVANSYLDVPIMAYLRLGRIELEAGVNAAFLIGSRGSGGITYSSNGIERFTTSTEFGYLMDGPGIESLKLSERNLLYNGVSLIIPSTIGAYYESADDDAKRFNRLDFGLNAGAAFFLNNGLYLGLRANYGLADVTKTEQDLDPVTLAGNNTEYTTRADEDRNITLQASVGFRF